ncbi:hypothetical protein [Listeria innocua]|uniref:hypothetical protein n=1 Tax=Listeria innocua TaxID=1642 RepID=UPI001627B374|nr:hypothetical protein [Listeria innocua]MBC1925550.1 hypothetical protein [Listeria innocua]
MTKAYIITEQNYAQIKEKFLAIEPSYTAWLVTVSAHARIWIEHLKEDNLALFMKKWDNNSLELWANDITLEIGNYESGLEKMAQYQTLIPPLEQIESQFSGGVHALDDDWIRAHEMDAEWQGVVFEENDDIEGHRAFAPQAYLWDTEGKPVWEPFLEPQKVYLTLDEMADLLENNRPLHPWLEDTDLVHEYLAQRKISGVRENTLYGSWAWYLNQV